MSKRGALALAVALSCVAYGQEVRFIDMTAGKPRTELRYPPSPPPICEEGRPCVGGGWGGGSVSDGAANPRDPQALALYLLSIDPRNIDPEQNAIAEFRLLNSGLADIDVPVSPHLADLQPPDVSRAFDYRSIYLGITAVDKDSKFTRLLGHAYLQLFGSMENSATTITLKPGQWLRVRGILQWSNYPAVDLDADLEAVFTLRTNTYRPHPGGSSSEARNLYPNVTPTPKMPVHFVKPGSSKAPVRQP